MTSKKQQIQQNRENILKNVFKWGSIPLGLGVAGRYIYEIINKNKSLSLATAKPRLF